MFVQLMITGIVLGCIYGLIALGYSLIYKASGMISFVQGDIMTVGAFLGLTLYKTMKLPFAVSLFLTIVIAFALGMLLERGVIRPILKKNVMPAYVILATIAISYIIQNGTALMWGTVTQRFPQIFPIDMVKIIGINVQPEAIMCVALSLVCMAALHFFMTKTSLGTAMRASAMDAMAAESVGIDVSLATGITWAISAGLAAIAGMLIGPIYGVYTMLGAAIGRKGFSGAIIGGFGNMYGALVGGISLGLIETLTAGYIASNYKNLFAYVLLIAFLFVKPTGIFNEKAIHDV